MARPSYSLGSAGAKVTANPEEALRTAAKGLPVVAVVADHGTLAELLRGAPDRESRERLLAVMVGDPAGPQVAAAAAEMAAELWPWSRSG